MNARTRLVCPVFQLQITFQINMKCVVTFFSGHAHQSTDAAHAGLLKPNAMTSIVGPRTRLHPSRCRDGFYLVFFSKIWRSRHCPCFLLLSDRLVSICFQLTSLKSTRRVASTLPGCSRDSSQRRTKRFNLGAVWIQRRRQRAWTLGFLQSTQVTAPSPKASPLLPRSDENVSSLCCVTRPDCRRKVLGLPQTCVRPRSPAIDRLNETSVALCRTKVMLRTLAWPVV